MGVLVTAQQVADFYRALWAQCQATAPPELLRSGAALPPFLCRSLAFGDPQLPPDCTEPLALTGRADGQYSRIESGRVRVVWATANVSEVAFDWLGLEGYRLASPSEQRENSLRRAVALLDALNSPAGQCVTSFIGMILWLEAERDSLPPLTSSSFPQLPHLTVMTDKSSRELLPGSYLPEPGAWVLAEDLYHESLHQWLTATMMVHDIFTDDYTSAEGPLIDIPWRNTQWPLDRALHSLFVYTHIVELRIQHLHEADIPFMERDAVLDALPGAIEAMKPLTRQLDKQQACFTSAGRELLREIVAKSNDILSQSASRSSH